MSEFYFFDTYAFFEIIYGNPNYLKYSSARIITSVFNISELDYNLKKEMSKEKADEYARDFFNFVVPVTLDDIQNAMDLKILHKDLSIPDVIGYTIARRYGVKFLTGDKGFRDMKNVEFVKK